MTTAPNTGLTFQNANSLRSDELYAELINYLDVWLNCSVLAVGQAAPTGTEVDGDRYIVGIGTGMFTGHDGELAIKFSGTWFFFAPPTAGVPIIKNLDDGYDWECIAGVWAQKTSSGVGAFEDLSDVDVTGLADGDMMVWNATAGKWVPAAPSGGGVSGSMALLDALYEPPIASLVPIMTGPSAPSGTAFGDATYAAPWNVFSAREGGGWVAYGLPNSMGYQFTTAQVVKSYAIAPWMVDTVSARWIRTWKLQGSNDGVTYTDVDSRNINGRSWAAGAYRYFSCASNSTAYLYYRLYITANNGDGFAGIHRLELYDVDITAL